MVNAARYATYLLLMLLAAAGALSANDSPPNLAGSQPDTREHFEQSIDPFMRAIRNCEALTLHEGLPHPRWEPELLEQELQQKETIQIHGFHFYRAPLEVKLAEKRNLRRLCSQARSFQPYSGSKFCGGFHPDWCLTWKNGDAVYQVLVCLGCQEAQIHGPTSGLWTDFAPHAAGDLKYWLAKYGRQRPPSQAEEKAEEARFASQRDPLLQTIFHAESLQLFEGLPRPNRWQPATPPVRRPRFKLRGYTFYRPAIEPSAADFPKLFDLCTASASFTPYHPKFCGGFHPDWLLVWQRDQRQYRMLICFGCHEVIFDWDRQSLQGDISAESFKSLAAILQTYSTQKQPGSGVVPE